MIAEKTIGSIIAKMPIAACAIMTKLGKQL